MLQNEANAWNSALRLLSRRAYSKKEICFKLCSKGYSAEVVNKTIELLSERGYIDDAALCNMLFHKYYSTGKYGIRLIQAKLQQRGLADDIIISIATDYDLSLEYEKAINIVEKKFKQLSSDIFPAISRFLVRRGFSSNIISKVLHQMKGVE